MPLTAAEKQKQYRERRKKDKNKEEECKRKARERHGWFDENLPDEFRNPIGSWGDEDDYDEDDDYRHSHSTPFGFKIFSNPIEIHRFFEHQMHEMMKSIQMFDKDSIYGGPDFPALHPSMEPEDELVQPKGNDPADIRDKFLKPEYRDKNRAHLLPPDFSPRSNQDTDLDDRVKTGDLEIILGNLPFSSDSHTSPNTTPTPGGASMYFGQSVTSKTIRRPDGSVEHHRTVRNNQGHEETTVTRQIGDQSHSLTTQTDSNGVQQRVEKFVNLDEGKLDEFENKWNKQYQPAVPKLSDDETRPHNWFPFDKFFK